jgi:hypothetical protein
MPETLAAATVDRLLITRTFLHHRGPILQARPSDHWQGGEAVEHLTRWGNLMSASGEMTWPPLGRLMTVDTGWPLGRATRRVRLRLLHT